jgi:menaquinol-cytochrome c reductase iron-sulfur subunit
MMNEPLTRRRFLSRISLGLSALASVIVGIPIVAYLLSPLINPAKQTWRTLGPLNKFNVGETVEVDYDEPSPLPWAGQTARTAVWLRRTGETSFTAFSVNCTHLGCPVNWRQEANLFLCPCHGGVYYADGTVAGGPPPAPLTRYEARIQDGEVQILTRGLQFE